MSETLFNNIPEDRREIVQSALSGAFGRAQPSAIERITQGGSGALIYRVDVGGRPYLLRLESRRGNFDDEGRAYLCMQTAAEAGIAPPLHYAEVVAGVTITGALTDGRAGKHVSLRKGVPQRVPDQPFRARIRTGIAYLLMPWFGKRFTALRR